MFFKKKPFRQTNAYKKLITFSKSKNQRYSQAQKLEIPNAIKVCLQKNDPESKRIARGSFVEFCRLFNKNLNSLGFFRDKTTLNLLANILALEKTSNTIAFLFCDIVFFYYLSLMIQTMIDLLFC